MKIWRICKSKYAASAFSGTGAEKVGGRWNYPGHRMAYASENLSLATLELFVHVNPKVIPTDLVAVTATLPEGFSKTEIDAATLPANWKDYPAPSQLKEIGTVWLNENSTLALILPSAVSLVDKNVLLNPHHPEMKELSTEFPQPFDFDPRMFP